MFYIKYRFHTVLIALFSLLVACGGGESDTGKQQQGGNISKQALGKLLFEDTRLSANGNQSCASCHDAASGFTDPDVTPTAPVSEGSISGSFGNRNAPSSAYAGFSPGFGQTVDNAGNPVFVGGLFMDGRRDSLEAQAKVPFLNQKEMANTDEQDVVDKVRTASYAGKFRQLFGENIFEDSSMAYDSIAQAIAAFERSVAMNRFDSKFDCYLLDSVAYPLSVSEQAGLEAFDGQAKCSSCHSLEVEPSSGKVLLSNFQYFNIGVPRNLNNPDPSIDRGLGRRLGNKNEDGKFKTPTLRNIELTAPYMHNGVFASLEEVMEFYNIPEKWDATPAPEVNMNISTDVDFLDLSAEQITNIIAFMKTLTDGSGTGICF